MPRDRPRWAMETMPGMNEGTSRTSEANSSITRTRRGSGGRVGLRRRVDFQHRPTVGVALSGGVVDHVEAEPAAGSQDPPHFLQGLVAVGHVAQAEGNGHDIE